MWGGIEDFVQNHVPLTEEKNLKYHSSTTDKVKVTNFASFQYQFPPETYRFLFNIIMHVHNQKINLKTREKFNNQINCRKNLKLRVSWISAVQIGTGWSGVEGSFGCRNVQLIIAERIIIRTLNTWSDISGSS